jgi:hypothetical protein
MFLIHVQMDENYSRPENVPLEVHSLLSLSPPTYCAREREREEEGTMYLSMCRWMKFMDDDWIAQK